MKMLDRTKFLGGTDCGGILGLSRYKTPLQVWAEKTGRIEPVDISDKVCVKVGIELEDLVAKLFCDETGKKVRRVNDTLFHKDYDFLGANLDRRIVGEDAILECKTASAYKSGEWTGDEIPTEYILQCLHYLAITGAEKCYVAVLIGNQDFKWKEISRIENEEIIKTIVAKEVEFWTQFVIPKIMPAITSQDADTLSNLYPDVKDNEILLDDNVDAKIEAIENLSTQKKKIDEEIDLKENEIKALLKDNERAKTSKYFLTWKKYQRNSVDTKTLQTKYKDIYSAVLKTTEYKRFNYKAIGA
jgi:putative phage-type endonuclease